MIYGEVKTNGSGHAVLILKRNGVQVLTYTDTSSPIIPGGSSRAGVLMYVSAGSATDLEMGAFSAGNFVTGAPDPTMLYRQITGCGVHYYGLGQVIHK